ncbi:U5 small nuclear ribonucleoprotein TSSC4-like [Oscarella lobularis]|uniref:U5 small nuclear ribonucleoprotein TSSC4-like n=1 Tax=Oscarella lobularis TaxID=121494 RepID=UPI003313AF4C
MSGSKTFALSGTESDFRARAAAVFNSIPAPTAKTNESEADAIVMPPPSSRPQRRREAAKRAKPAPDHVLHPDKWTKYSLDDVNVCSDAQNSRAAFDFLAELRERKRKSTAAPGEDESKEDASKITFRKAADRCTEANERPGTKAKKKKAPNRSPTKMTSKEITLQHLQDEDEEEDLN